jgi:hypothetical protein
MKERLIISLKKIFWIFVALLWFASSFTFVIPFLWWLILGKEWYDLETIFKRIDI